MFSSIYSAFFVQVQFTLKNCQFPKHFEKNSPIILARNCKRTFKNCTSSVIRRTAHFSFPIPKKFGYPSPHQIKGMLPLLPMKKSAMTQNFNKEAIQFLESHIAPFLIKHGLSPTKESVYFNQLITTIARCTLLLNPSFKYDAQEMILYSKILGWNWVLDEALESTKIEVYFKLVPILVKETAKIIKREDWNCEKVKEFPKLQNLLSSLEEVMDIWSREFLKDDLISDSLDEKVHLIEALSNYFYNFGFLTYNNFNKDLTSEEFRQWRRWDGFIDFNIEISAALLKVKLPREIRSNRLLQRCVELSARHFVFANDLFGLPKDFGQVDPKTIIFFEHKHKSRELEKSVEICLALLIEETNEYLRCRETLSKFFPQNEDLIKYMSVVDAYHGQNVDLYEGYGSDRYGPKGCVKIVTQN